jgi:DNA-3-methyladenine glycosylase II
MVGKCKQLNDKIRKSEAKIIKLTMSLHHKVAIDALNRDEFLAPIIPTIEMPDFNPSFDVYADLIESIVSQQLSVKAAATIYKRLLDKMPQGYPHPEYIQELTLEEMRAVGLSGQKSQYIKNVAAFAQERDLLTHDWAAMTDEEVLAMLTSIKGVGVWTVQMILMFTLDRPDVFPEGDLGIQHAMAKLFKLDLKSKTLKKDMVTLSERWKPYRTYACRILWRYKDLK